MANTETEAQKPRDTGSMTKQHAQSYLMDLWWAWDLDVSPSACI